MDPTTKQVAKDFALSEVRRLVSAAAAIAVADGVITSDQTGAFVQIGISVVMYAGMMIWSWYQSKGRAELAAAKAQLEARIRNQILAQKVSGVAPKPQP